MIAEGPTLSGGSRRSIKAYGRSVAGRKEINMVEWSSSATTSRPNHILQETENVVYPHDDALVITLIIVADRAARTLVDIIFIDILDQLTL